MPKLTVGMAHARDFDGVYFTIQSIRKDNPQHLEDLEFVVVDNQPNSDHSPMLKDFLNGLKAGGQAATYVALPEPIGTSPSRNAVFLHATGDAVLCVDCHVLLEAPAIGRLLRHYADHPATPHLHQGPLVYDNLREFTTHFNDEWRGEMWGTWGRAWKCGCGPNGSMFSTMNSNNHARYVAMEVPLRDLQACESCGGVFPPIAWAGHEKVLRNTGYKDVAADPNAPAFDIPGQGLGLFTCRREAWLGFNPHARRFGGEEMYIHAKYRQAGHRALCLPWLRWIHRFGRPGGVPYPLDRYNKVRNYVLELNELGLPLDPVHEHFVASKLLSETEWAYLLEDPIAHDAFAPQAASGSKAKGCGGCGAKAPEPQEDINTLEEAFQWAVTHPRDMEKHLPKLKELAAQCDHVTEISYRKESTVALAAGEPRVLVSFNSEGRDPVSMSLDSAAKGRLELVRSGVHPDHVGSFHPTDLLFMDTIHTYALTLALLQRHARHTKRFIVLHDTQLYGYRDEGEADGPGMWAAIRVFMTENPQWSVVYHTDQQYGLTVLGCLDEDKPKLPGKITMAANLAKAVAEHVVTGAKQAEPDEYKARLEACQVCDQRRDDRCAVCGCYILEKAKWLEQPCPLGRWPQLPVVEGGDA